MSDNESNQKSDRIAKEKYVQLLKKKGFDNPRIISRPADICAQKDGITYYYEIKMTRKQDKYFGAATLTEWEQALKDPNHFFFVVALQNGSDISEFREYTPDEFIEFSSIPPFKINFNMDLLRNSKSTKKNSKTKCVKATYEKIQRLLEFYKELQKSS